MKTKTMVQPKRKHFNLAWNLLILNLFKATNAMAESISTMVAIMRTRGMKFF